MKKKLKRSTKRKTSKKPVKGNQIAKARGLDGIGYYAHSLLSFALVVVLAGLVYFDLTAVAVGVYLVSKWRILAVQPRYWWANLRSNIPDIAVCLSFIHQLDLSNQLEENSLAFLLVWATLFIGWQLVLKPRSTNMAENIQAVIAQIFGLSTLMYFYGSYPEWLIVILTWFLSLAVARHFLYGYEEVLTKTIAVTWALFVTQLVWVMGRWLLVFEVTRTLTIPYVAVLIGAVQYACGSLYHHYKSGDLKKPHIRQFVLFICAIMLMLILFSNWTTQN